MEEDEKSHRWHVKSSPPMSSFPPITTTSLLLSMLILLSLFNSISISYVAYQRTRLELMRIDMMDAGLMHLRHEATCGRDAIEGLRSTLDGLERWSRGGTGTIVVDALDDDRGGASTGLDGDIGDPSTLLTIDERVSFFDDIMRPLEEDKRRALDDFRVRSSEF
jgi:hypothetical protein